MGSCASAPAAHDASEQRRPVFVQAKAAAATAQASDAGEADATGAAVPEFTSPCIGEPQHARLSSRMSSGSIEQAAARDSVLLPVHRKKGDRVGHGLQAGTGDLAQLVVGGRRMQARNSSAVEVVSEEEQDDVSAKVHLFETFLRAVHAVSSETNSRAASERIIVEACLVLNCERSTLFLVDNDSDELEMFASKDTKGVRMPRGRGLAGAVATTGESILISDAHKDPRFDSTHDKATGFRTRAVCACPVRDKDGAIVGVLMCMNPHPRAGGRADDAVFGPLEKVLAENFASHTGLILRNCQLYEEGRAAARKVEILLDIVSLLHDDPNTNSLIFTLSNRAHTLLDADRTTLYLVHKPSSTLVVQQGQLDFKVPITKGLAGHVAQTGKTVNIPDCYADPRFDQTMDRKTGFKTKTMLSLPIFRHSKSSAGTGEVIGVLQVINKVDDLPFTEQDERLLRTLLDLSGPILAASTFFVQASHAPLSEAERMRQGPRQLQGVLSEKSAAAAAAAKLTVPEQTTVMTERMIDEGAEEEMEEEQS